MKATGSAMAIARRLQRGLSLPEQLLWRLLRMQRRAARFRRQHPIGPYVADFYGPKAKLVIEVDGQIHGGRTERDAARDAYMTSLGLTVVRVVATDVLDDPEAVADGLVRLAEASVGPSTPQLR